MDNNSSIKYEIYIGLKDQDTMLEHFTPDDFAKMLSEQCKNKKIGFSLTTQLGGYTHNKGYVTETSLRITLFGIDESEVLLLGETLKKKINTDTIMITSEICEYSYIWKRHQLMSFSFKEN